VRVAWLLPDLTLSGGTGIVVQHARQLQRAHGMDVTLVRAKDVDAPDWAYPGIEELRVVDLADVAGEAFDVAIATWWETALRLYDVRAERHAYFLQLLEDSQYPPGAADRLGFPATLGLPVRFVTAATWIRDTVERAQPGNAAFLVLSGMDKAVWAPPAQVPADDGGPLRVVVEGSLSLVRKGVPHALEAVRLMREPAHVTLVSGDGTAVAPPPGVDVQRGGLSHTELAALLRGSHVLLKLSRAEGMYGPPLEAAHCACTTVTNPVTGHEEYLRHGENCLVVDWDDPHGTARALDLLARDRALLARLRAGALATAQAWPSWAQAGAELAEVLRRLHAEPPPDPAAAGRRAAREAETAMAVTELREIDARNTAQALDDLASQRTVQAALRARRAATPVLRRAKGVRSRLRR
jgi:glycosyltransferase involved in cell wall biosynthesis